MVLIFGGFGHDDDEHDNLTGVDSTPDWGSPVNCGEEKNSFRKNASQKLLTTNEGGGGNQVCLSLSY